MISLNSYFPKALAFFSAIISNKPLSPANLSESPSLTSSGPRIPKSTSNALRTLASAIVEDWIERRPLRHLARVRYPGLAELFEGLRRKGKVIGILSDYPARAKLDALGLTADHVICAGDKGVGLLKPNPRGLETLIAAAGTQASATVLIGDRAERDGLAASRAGAKALIKSSRPVEGFQTFVTFDDPLFAPFL